MAKRGCKLPLRRIRLAAFVVLSSLCALSSPLSSNDVFARDLQGRLGLGYNSQFANSSAPNGVPGISLKYGLTRDFAAAAVIGLSTATPKNSVTAVKLFKNLFFETNLNFYATAAAGLLSGGGNSGLELIGAFGAEFFIPGLESLGFSFEMGASLDNLGDNLGDNGFALKTHGASFLDAGIHFYF